MPAALHPVRGATIPAHAAETCCGGALRNTGEGCAGSGSAATRASRSVIAEAATVRSRSQDCASPMVRSPSTTGAVSSRPAGWITETHAASTRSRPCSRTAAWGSTERARLT